jgi:hypothetical protein
LRGKRLKQKKKLKMKKKILNFDDIYEDES